MVQDMGFASSSYWDGTAFPVPADAVAEYSGVNAHCYGNGSLTGVGRFTFGVAASGQPVGIAADSRVPMHEFGHALLWDSVHSANFGFAHSAGDSIAAILHDPGTAAPDRFVTFPWIPIGRRHDRTVAAGWGWGGTMDLTDDSYQYQREQILSTTLFRAYLATGGGAAYADTATRLAIQRIAARYMVYLIVRAIGSLATAPITATPTANVFATALMNADIGTASFEGQPGGAYNKVLRWAFEKQGLYQPAGAPSPVVTAGAPPAVDVYIDDGRAGEYGPFLDDFWETTDIWNVTTPNPSTTPADHTTPIVDVPNYVYVRVKNRGTQTAHDVYVKGFHCRPSTGLLWPGDWQAMTTAQLPAAGSPGLSIPANGSVTLGPFAWTPTVAGHECLLMMVNATGDLSNAEPGGAYPCASGPTPHWRLVPFDNNLAQRNVAPVAGGGGLTGLAASFVRRHFWIDNPYDRTVEARFEVTMPEFLARRGWQAKFDTPQVALAPHTSREIVFSLVAGDDFGPRDVPGDARIRVRTLMDDVIVGGMTYAVDPALTAPPVEYPSHKQGITRPAATGCAVSLALAVMMTVVGLLALIAAAAYLVAGAGAPGGGAPAWVGIGAGGVLLVAGVLSIVAARSAHRDDG
jgi:hypothetical protein